MSKGFLKIWQPNLSFVRYRKVNVQKPFPPHFVRAVVEHVCKPILPVPAKKDPTVPPHQICLGSGPYFQKQIIENPYVDLLAKDLLNWFNHSKLIAFFHVNPMESSEMYEARLALKKKLSMNVKLYGKEVVKKAVEGTKYEVILSLYKSHTCLAYGPNPDVSLLLNITKKMPKLILLAGVVEERLVSKAELERMSRLGDLERARGELVGVVQQQGQRLASHLTHHPHQLVRHLDHHLQLNTNTS